MLYVVLELCEGGDVYEFLFNTGPFPEPIAKNYYKQIIEGVQAIHESGWAHRDLKCENLLFSKEFEMKISDFGFSLGIQGRKGDEIMLSQLGTV